MIPISGRGTWLPVPNVEDNENQIPIGGIRKGET